MSSTREVSHGGVHSPGLPLHGLGCEFTPSKSEKLEGRSESDFRYVASLGTREKHSQSLWQNELQSQPSGTMWVTVGYELTKKNYQDPGKEATMSKSPQKQQQQRWPLMASYQNLQI